MSEQHPVYERFLELAERRSSLPPDPMIDAREKWQQGFSAEVEDEDILDTDATLPMGFDKLLDLLDQ
jgi:hypothetical protein